MEGYNIEAGANSLLQLTEAQGIETSPMKLQKLLYLAHGYYLGATGNPLVDEEFEAWEYGPVSPTIYHDLKQYGKMPIPSGRRVSRLNAREFVFETPYVSQDDATADWILAFVVKTYGTRTAIYLSDLTHKIGSPWEVVKKHSPHARNAHINNSIIKDYFSTLIKPSSVAAA